MKRTVDVNTGDVKVGTGRMLLRSVAIGSCIVVAAYDPKKRIGGMAHIMLPGSAPEGTAQKTKYAANAIDELLGMMSKRGSINGDVEVCLVGAGNVLERPDDTICEDNIRSTSRLLQQRQIPVRTAVLGGTDRKGVFLDVEHGDISYTKGDGTQQLLWRSICKSTDIAN